jgi:hypothetical protein
MKPDRRVKWIVEMCTDNFEGIPCSYPNCTCDPRNKARFEKEYEDEVLHRRPVRGKSRDSRGE